MYYATKFMFGFALAILCIMGLLYVVGVSAPASWLISAAPVPALDTHADIEPNPASALYIDPALLAEQRKKMLEPRVSFVLLGDVMLARGVHARNAGTWETLFSELGEPGAKVFGNVDGTLANLEGVFMEEPDRSDPKTFTFHFDTDAVQALTHAGVTHVSLANNHSDNGAAAGTAYTHAVLDAASIAWVGGHDSASPAHVGVILGTKLDLVIIGVNLTYAETDITKIVEQYARNPKTRVLVYPHWGTEYAPRANAQQRRLAREWVDAGADLVVGSHPHVVQDMEVYNGVPIIYSLGNTVFDQNWSQDTSEGLIIAGEFKNNALTLQGVPIEITHGVPRVAREASLMRVFERIGYQLSHTTGTVFMQPGATVSP